MSITEERVLAEVRAAAEMDRPGKFSYFEGNKPYAPDQTYVSKARIRGAIERLVGIGKLVHLQTVVSCTASIHGPYYGKRWTIHVCETGSPIHERYKDISNREFSS